MRIPELLAPAKDLRKAKIAIMYGADAVYIGGKHYSLRSRASNFDLKEIEEAVLFAHAHNAKIYVTVNIVFHDEDLAGIKEYLRALDEIGIDAIIVESLGLISLCKKEGYHFETHVSTQFSSLNSKAVSFLASMGVERVVLAREATMEEIEEISSKVDTPLEVFIHGGMCANVSGRCTLSNWMTNRDANRGGCAQSCRWRYSLYEEDKDISCPNIPFSMGSKDLMALAAIKRMCEANVASLKIEGRMKSDYYIATVVRTYRYYLDMLKTGEDPSLLWFEKEIAKAENRSFSSGFLLTKMDANKQLYGEGEGARHDYVADILSYDEKSGQALILTHNPFKVGDSLEAFGPHLPNTIFTLKSIKDEDGNMIEAANSPMSKVYISLPFKVEEGDMIRKVLL